MILFSPTQASKLMMVDPLAMVFDPAGGGGAVMEMDAVLAIEDAQGEPDDLLTAAMIAAAFKGTSPGTVSLLHHDPLETTRVCAPAGVPMLVPLSVGGQIWDGTNANGWRFDLDDESVGHDEVWEGFQVSTGGAFGSLLIVTYVKLPTVMSGDFVSLNNDWVHIAGDRGYSVPQQIRNAGTCIIHGHSEGELGNDMPVDSNTDLFELWVFYDNANALGQYALLKDGVVVGASDSLMGGPSGTIAYFLHQSYLTNHGGEARFYVAGYQWTSPVYPPRTVAVPPVTLLAGPLSLVFQSNLNEVTVRGSSGMTRFDIERKTGAGAFGALVSNHRLKTTSAAKAYADGTVVDATTYTYRMRARLGSLVSAWITSDPITIDNAGLHLTWGGAVASVTVASSAAGKRGVQITVGGADFTIAEIGCYFDTSGNTYADVEIEIFDAGESLAASATVPFAGSAPEAENFTPLVFTFEAGLTYTILRDVSGFNAFSLTGTRTVNTSLATIDGPRDEAFTDPGGNGYCGGINFKT